MPAITRAIDKAYSLGIIILASASNKGANQDITFPARLRSVFCIGAADGKGSPSGFNPPHRGVEKYSTLGEAVSGADVLGPDSESSSHATTTLRSGTSTATPIAAAIASLLLDYTLQILDPVTGPGSTARIRKLFLAMSKATVGSSYRYIVPWSILGANIDTKKVIKDILKQSPGMPSMNRSNSF